MTVSTNGRCPSQEHWEDARLDCSCTVTIYVTVDARFPARFTFSGCRGVWIVYLLYDYTRFDLLIWLSRSLGPENLLLKGATLKNTQKICGESKHNAIIYWKLFTMKKKKCQLFFFSCFCLQVLQFTLAWKQKWLLTIRANLRNVLLWRSTFSTSATGN